jgi:predicted nucleic acid-binding protein
MFLLDTTVLVAAFDERRACHAHAHGLLRGEKPLAVSTQSIREALATATRPPSANGLGITFAAAWRSLSLLRQRCGRLLLEDDAWWLHYTELAVKYQPLGRAIYDLGQVAHALRARPGCTLISDDEGLIRRYGHLVEIRSLADV